MSQYKKKPGSVGTYQFRGWRNHWFRHICSSGNSCRNSRAWFSPGMVPCCIISNMCHALPCMGILKTPVNWRFLFNILQCFWNKNDIHRSLISVMLIVTFVYLFLNISLMGSLGSPVIGHLPPRWQRRPLLYSRLQAT